MNDHDLRRLVEQLSPTLKGLEMPDTRFFSIMATAKSEAGNTIMIIRSKGGAPYNSKRFRIS